MAKRYKIWVEIECIENEGTDAETYTDVDFPEPVGYRDNVEDAFALQKLIIDSFGEI